VQCLPRQPSVRQNKSRSLLVKLNFINTIVMRPKTFLRFFMVIILTAITFSVNAQAGKNYFTVENYYKVKWGYAEEFISLWKTNHYPLLKKAIEKGDIISVEASTPKLHSGEDTRWDFRVIIVFANSQAAFDPNLTTPYKKQLYPDLDRLTKDEQHRFELLISHWDVMTDKVALP
jgi:hypothetical protein